MFESIVMIHIFKRFCNKFIVICHFFIVSFNLYTAIPKSPPKQTMVYTMTGENGDMMPEGVPKKKGGGHH